MESEDEGTRLRRDEVELAEGRRQCSVKKFSAVVRATAGIEK